MDLAFITIILQLIFLECILSIDNAAVLGAMVAPLPNDRPVPWPRTFRGVLSKLDPFLGPQRQAALKVGLLGAYAGRVLMLFLASIIIQNVWMQILGAAYLIYLAIRHFGEAYRYGKDLDDEIDIEAIRPDKANFWSVVLTIELADLAFSLDNVIAAVALSDQLWVVIFGVAIGIVMMRFAAQIFTRMIAWEPALEHAAYLLLFAIGGELLLEHYLHLELTEWGQFGISLGIIVLVVLFARVKVLRPMHAIFKPFALLFALINDALSFVFRILGAPFRRRHREIDEAPPHWPPSVPVTTKDAPEEQL
jgi:YkoY family integral membrane protein